MMMSRTIRPRAVEAPGGHAFTLIELILVMALLSIAVAVSFPTLRQFFRGRVLDSEAHRLLALTRYGQSRAVAEGTPMFLWIDEREGTYGLEAAATYIEEDPRALDFRLDNDLQIEVSAPPPDTLTVLPNRAGPMRGTSRRSLTGLPLIRFLPDGYIGEPSPEYLELREGAEDVLWIAQATNRLTYELRTNPPARQRR